MVLSIFGSSVLKIAGQYVIGALKMRYYVVLIAPGIEIALNLFALFFHHFLNEEKLYKK